MNNEEPIAPETLAAIFAAATAFVGKSIRLSSVKELAGRPQDGNRWTRLGRAAVHGSHNLVHASRSPFGRR